MLHLNIQSLRNRLELLNHYLPDHFKVSILCISKNRITDDKMLHNVDGYKITTYETKSMPSIHVSNDGTNMELITKLKKIRQSW